MTWAAAGRSSGPSRPRWTPCHAPRAVRAGVARWSARVAGRARNPAEERTHATILALVVLIGLGATASQHAPARLGFAQEPHSAHICQRLFGHRGIAGIGLV